MNDEELRVFVEKYRRECEKRKEWSKRWRENNKEKMREINKRYRDKKKELVEECRRRGLIK